MLLRGGANPLLTFVDLSNRVTFLVFGRGGGSRTFFEVVRELIRKFRIKSCGDDRGGVDASSGRPQAACRGHHGVVDTSAGVVDTGQAPTHAAGCGQVESVKLLLNQETGAVSYTHLTLPTILLV